MSDEDSDVRTSDLEDDQLQEEEQVEPIILQKQTKPSKKRKKTSIWCTAKRKKPKTKRTEADVQLIEKNKLLLSECNELKTLNEKLAEENAKLRSEIESHTANVNTVETPEEPKPEEKKESVRIVAALTTDTLISLWEEVSSIALPKCRYITAPRVAKKRTTTIDGTRLAEIINLANEDVKEESDEVVQIID